MLEKIDLKKTVSKSTYDKKFDKLVLQVGALQRQLRDTGVPVIILFEGFRGTWRSALISKVVSALDPRGYRVFSASKTTEHQKTLPFFTQFWKELPAKGQIALHHRAWYFLKNEHDVGDKDEAAEWYNVGYDDINSFEKELVLENYKIIKFFTHISKKQQEKNLKSDKGTNGSQWESLTPGGIEGIDYKAYKKVYENMLAKTDTDYAPWHIVPMEDLKTGIINVLETLVEEMKLALATSQKSKKSKVVAKKDKTVPDILSTYDLSKALTVEEYKEKLKTCHEKIVGLQLELFKKKISVVCAFEGWDAGGKGGAIKRLVGALDPLGYRVNPVSAPTALENSYHYLWRFWQHVPEAGEMAVFDRTWYGRVLVERVEHFASAEEWKRAYQEINEMEAQWSKHDIIVQKFWLQIDKDEQYNRFEARENDPDKTWKITEEDWRNRDKWDAYVDAVNEMLYRTDTQIAPWTVVEAKDKYYARIKVLETVIARMEKALKK